MLCRGLTKHNCFSKVVSDTARQENLANLIENLGVLLVFLSNCWCQLESGWAHCRPTAENHRHLRCKNTSSWRSMPALLVLVLFSSRNTPAESTTQSAISLVNLISKSIIPQLTKTPCFAVCFPIFRGVSLVQFSAHRVFYKPQLVHHLVSYVQSKLRSLDEMGHYLNQCTTWANIWRMPQSRLSFLLRATYNTLPCTNNLWLCYGDNVQQHHGKPPAHIVRMQSGADPGALK